jgi:hypothetical protein
MCQYYVLGKINLGGTYKFESIENCLILNMPIPCITSPPFAHTFDQISVNGQNKRPLDSY